MSGHLRPWRPEDFDDRCETCGAPAGQLCRAGWDTGYTAEDAAAKPSCATRREEPRAEHTHQPCEGVNRPP